MSTIPLQSAASNEPWTQPSRGVVGMAGLIIAESAIFAIVVTAYLYYAGRDVSGPTPREVLEIPIFGTMCLLSSSGFIMLAERAIEHGKMAAFLADTANEWHKLIVHDHLTIRTNLFGTTFYTLVGLHASHVIVGLLMMLVVLAFALKRKVLPAHAERVKVLAMYWHFVDAVWVVVFTVVYIIGR